MAPEAAASKNTPATPVTPDVPTDTNPLIPASAIYRSGTTGAGRITLKKMPEGCYDGVYVLLQGETVVSGSDVSR
jgi:hypothetical protein